MAAADIRRAESETFLRLKLKPEPESADAFIGAATSKDVGLLSDEIGRKKVVEPIPSIHSVPANAEEPVEYWRFSDDEE